MGKKVFPAFIVFFFVLGFFSVVYAQTAGAQAPAPSDGKVLAQPVKKVADQPDPTNYFILKGGAFWPKGDLQPLGTGFTGEFAYGWRFSQYAAVELGSGYLNLGKTLRQSDPDFGTITNKQTVYAVPLTLALKPIIPITKEFEVFGLIGAGGYYINNSNTFTIPGEGSVKWTGHSVTYGGFVGAGVNYNLTRNWFVGVEGKYLSTARPKYTTNIFGERLVYNFRTEGIISTFNVGYRF